MRTQSLPPKVLLLPLLSLLSLLVACGTGPSGLLSTGAAPDASLGGDFPTLDASIVTLETGSAPLSLPPDVDAAEPETGPLSGAFDAALPPSDDGGEAEDAAPPFDEDASGSGACTTALGFGDLVIDELMIESVAGTGDHGEWIEIRSTRACSLDIAGLHAECPTGSKVITFDQLGDLWLPPFGTFLLADSSEPAVDHELPGAIVTWTGNPGDVLRNEGTTVTLSAGGVLVDTVTYPKLKLTPGTSYAFPAGCDDSMRGNFALWAPSTASWFPGFWGTPNAPNADVPCPM